ncbi:radical SAM protein [Thermodesulfobacteriota bacterium]
MYTTTAENYSFETGIYRPPSEGGSYSLLLRVTRNCPWNKCTFCAMYKGEKFAARPAEDVIHDIDSIASLCNDLKTISIKLGYDGRICREAVIALIKENPSLNTSHGFSMVLDWLQSGGKTAFLQDANSLVMNSNKLVKILRHLRETFPSLERVTSYCRSKTLSRKTLDELKAICQAGLDRVHVGLETGDDLLLEKIKKGASSADHINGGRKAMEAGFQLSEYWMPGLGGKEMWKTHAEQTSKVLNEINPHYIRSRPFFPAPGTPLYVDYQKGESTMLSPKEQLEELKLMVEVLDVTSKVCFDHAGNYWTGKNGRLIFSHSYEGYKFPEEKQTVLDLIDEGIKAQKKSPVGPPRWLIR